MVWLLLYIIASVVLFGVHIYILVDAIKKYDRTSDASRNETHKSLKKFAVSVGVIGIVFPVLWLLLPFFILAPIVLRRKRIKCVCGHNMRLLSEKEEDAYLNEKEQYEEELRVIDYDVWLCDACGRTTKYYYNKLKSVLFVDCPLCHYKAGKKVKSETLVYATYEQGGTERNTYACQHCKHEFVLEESTPKLDPPRSDDDDTSNRSWRSSSSSGSSSSSSSGSFGGGRSGGGGYTGKW